MKTKKRNTMKKIASTNCLCGKLNEQRILKSIHKRLKKCPMCKEWTYTKEQALFCIDLELSRKEEFEHFAISWG